MVRIPPSARTLRDHPDLDQLKRQAKELREAFVSGAADAVAEVNAHYRGANPATFALHDAQLALARSYGFDSWPKLKAYVDGVTLQRFVDAVRAGNLSSVRAMLERRPELAHMSIDNYQVLHFAVLDRSPEMVRVLIEHGANAREGVYPHRDATSPLTIATERGYDEIVAVIRGEEERRRSATSGVGGAPEPDALFQAIASGDDDRALAMLEAHPALVRTCHPVFGVTPLHVAAERLNAQLVAWLLDHRADAKARDLRERTPLDVAAGSPGERDAERFANVAALLLARGAPLTASAAVALGREDWLRARHAEGALTNPIEDSGGLLRIAVSHNRPKILALLLDFGLDPDERKRLGGGEQVAFTWGMPLWHCAATGKHDMAEMLLQRGADPNAMVYASGTPLYQAYGRRDWQMVELLERDGGRADATAAALYRRTDLAKQLLASATNPRSVAEELLGSAACGGEPEIVRMALEHVDWPRDDPRWFGVLEQPLRIWNHGSGHWANFEWDRGTYLTCFRLVLARCDPNIRGRGPDRQQFGLTILHSIAGSRKHVTPEERVAFATMLLDAGARLDSRDNLLKSTPLGWACRWGRVELVKLLLARGADPVEADAEPWATPEAWAKKMNHDAVLGVLRDHASA